MFKFPYLALTHLNSHYLAQTRPIWIPILISHPTLSVISQLLHKGKTPKSTNFKSLKGKQGFYQSHPSGISAMLSIEAFSLGNELVHVQAVSGSSIDSPVVTPRHDNVK